MKMLYLSPVTRGDTEWGRRQCAERTAFLNRVCSPDITFELVEIGAGPKAIESAYDSVVVAPQALHLGLRLQDQYAAIVLGCFGDPGLEAMREVLDIPVVGASQSTFAIAAQFGNVGVLSTASLGTVRRRRVFGVEAAYWGIGIDVLDVARDREFTLARLVEVGQQAIEAGSQVLTLGCMSLAFMDIAPELQARLEGVPVVNPVRAAVSMAESLVQCGLGGTGKGKKGYRKAREALGLLAPAG